MNIREDLTLGIDLGIGSCGWAIIRQPNGSGGEIVDMGVWLFDVPETDKERKPTNQLRRQQRGMRRVLRRRRQRMNDLRAMFKTVGLLESRDKNALKVRGLDPWRLRADGLNRLLSPLELAIVLGHIAKHRGFKSNSKRDRGANAPKDSSEMLQAIESTRARLADYRTVGEMFAKHPDYAKHKRNRNGDYSRSVLRDDQATEVALLFDRQQKLGSAFATDDLKRRYVEIAFFQRPFADSDGKVGDCPFEDGEKRAAKHSYSFELFRLLARLTALRVGSGRDYRPLSAEQIAAASADFGTHRGLTFKRLRKLIYLESPDRFDGVAVEDEGKRDVVSRSGDMAPGTYVLRDVLGQHWQMLLESPETLDRIAAILTFRESPDTIRQGLGEIGLDHTIIEKLMQAVERGDFSGFKGAGHISAKACRAIIPHLKRGLVYSAASKEAGYDHSRRPVTDPDDIKNPIARKAVTESIKQVSAIIQEYGLPGRIHVELARDVGKSIDERKKVERGIEDRNKAKDRLKEQFRECVGQAPREGSEDLLRYELWREQNGRCLYTDQAIHPRAVVASDNSVQVDHILPWSRSGDDSFINKTLCLASANQQKKGRTPFEWFSADQGPADWDLFVQRIETNKAMKGRKKRNFVLKDASILEEKFRSRNLNDTRYASRILLDELTRLYQEDGKRHVFARPGPLTDRLRRGWGIQDLKKGPDGKRLDDSRHHALDALVVAATSESVLQDLTRAFQAAERIGAHRDFIRLNQPWPGFAEQARERLIEVFVARAERRRARGEAHAATIRAISERDGKTGIYERRAVEKLTIKDLGRINDPERNAALIGSLRAWIEAGKPKDRLPLSPKGDTIAKVRLLTDKKTDVLVRGGAAERGEMVRVDVFFKPNRKGRNEYFLVPIYPHQVADAVNWPTPPNCAVLAHQDESRWPGIDASYEFLWSIYPQSFLDIEKSDGVCIEGYFRGMDRAGGSLSLSPHNSSSRLERGIGARTLKSFRKYTVDRLGRRHEVLREARTWHGVVCT